MLVNTSVNKRRCSLLKFKGRLNICNYFRNYVDSGARFVELRN